MATYFTSYDAIKNVSVDRIVTEQRGSWLWQDAFRVVTYTPRLTDSGRILGEVYSYTTKLSEPQIRRRPYYANLLCGSLHNRPFPRSAFPEKCARYLESHGWEFEA